MKLAVQSRTILGKKVKELRQSGLVPGVVYGNHLAGPMSITINKIALVKAYKKTGMSTPVELSGDIDELVLFHDLQLDPVTDHVIHVDFIAVQRDVKVRADVPVILTGVSPFEKDGLGRVQLIRDHIHVEAFPMDLPHDIKIDISAFDHEGMVVTAKDLKLGSKVELSDDEELTIVTTVAFAEEKEEEEEEVLVEGEEGAEGEGGEEKAAE